MSDKKLDGKVAVITGASKGLGKAMGLALGAAGASVVLVSRNLEQLNEVARAIKDAGGEALVFQSGRLRRRPGAQARARYCGQVRQGPSILINNAGINIRKPLVEFKLEEWHRVLKSGLASVFSCVGPSCRT